MFETVRDNVALLEYRQVVGERFGQVAPDTLVNYVAEVPDFLTPYARRPEIAEFDGELYIMGGSQDLPFHCAYIKQNPATEYNVAVFTSEDAARDRAVSLFGVDPEDLLALAASQAPDVVAEDLLEEFGDDMYEAGRFSRQSNKTALSNRRDDPLAKLRTVSNISNVIKASITGFDAKTVNKAPLLIGHSGISKSATIKSVIKELNSGVSEASGNWGYRLVDIRAAFFDKMDLLGMITLTSESDGSDGSMASQMNERWTDSPKLELLTCTTAFVESCRSMVAKVDNGEVEVGENDDEFVSRLREYAKTPVMFFDEINRTPKEVMNQLMVMINGHALNDYDISIAPKLAAANLPVEIEKLDDLEPEAYEKLIYLVQNVDDAAKIDRFIPYIVSSDDPTIQRSAFDYLIGLPNVEKHDVLKELAQYGFDNQILHDISAMDTDGKFPTFRGWEDVMQYLSWAIENDETPYLAVIKGLVGDKTAAEVARQLEASGVDVDLDTNDTSNFVDHTYRAGLPMMLLGRMGIAKTAKINKAIKDNGDESIRIDLSSTDRVNVGGFPRPAPFLREAFGFGFKEKGVGSKDEAMALKLAAVQSPLFQQFEDEVKAAGEVPHQTTSYVPNKQLQDKLDEIRASQEEGKRLVLVFDEINRCSPVVQSAVFEAISDCFVGDTRIRLLDGSEPTLRELEARYGGTDEGFWVYATAEDGSVVAGYAHHPRKVSGATKQLVRVTLDNGKSEICTDDHKWRLRDGSYREAKDLTSGTSLMPLYTRVSDKRAGDALQGYEQVWDNAKGAWYYTHRHIAQAFGEIPHMSAEGELIGSIRAAANGVVVHHKDVNKRNNAPENLVGMYFSDHVSWHGANLDKTRAQHADFEERRLAGLRAHYASLTEEERESLFGRKDPVVQQRRAAAVSASFKDKEDDPRIQALRTNAALAQSPAAIAKKSASLKSHFANNPEARAKSRQNMEALNARLWHDEAFAESRAKHSAAMSVHHKEQANRPENVARMREVAVNYNRDPAMKVKQLLGRCYKVFAECLLRYQYVDEESYEAVRKEIAPRQPSYGKMLGLIEEAQQLEAQLPEHLEQLVHHNHKVVSVEFLDYQEDVYDITVDVHHNFALASGVFVHNSRLFGCDLRGIDYSVVAAGNYDDSEGFDAESGSMGSTFDAAPIDTATMHRFATQIVRELTEEDVVQFMDYLKDNLPAAYYIAEKIGSEALMELLNTSYEEMADDDGDEDSGGLANPVFTMRTLQALHNMLTVQHPYVMASIAMEEAASSVPYAGAPKAQAEAFVAVYENPNLILFAEDKGMGFPAKELNSAGLSAALDLPRAGTVKAVDVFTAIRDVCISISNGEQSVIDKLTEEFGTLNDFMFRVTSVIGDIEMSLDNSSTQLTYQGIVPSYAMDVVGEAVEAFYTENSVKAAKGVVFDVTSLFDESLDDDSLTQLISRFMGTVASETQLDFATLFLGMMTETLDNHPDITPTAAHLQRLRDLFNLHPLAAARPLSAERLAAFLMSYQNKVSGAVTAAEAMSKVSVELAEWMNLVEAGSRLLSSYVSTLKIPDRSMGSYIPVLAKRVGDGSLDLYHAALTSTAHDWDMGLRYSTRQDALDYINSRGIEPSQLLALLGVWSRVTADSPINSKWMNSGYTSTAVDMSGNAVALGTVEGADGYLYPDYNVLALFSTSTYQPITGSGEGTAQTGLVQELVMREVFTLSRIDAGSSFSDLARSNSKWYVDMSFRGNSNGVAVEVKVPDVLAVAGKSLALPKVEGNLYGEDERAHHTSALMLAAAKAATNDTPATSPIFMGNEGMSQLDLLSHLNSRDVSFSTAFLQLNYDIELTKKGSRTAAEKVEAFDLLRRPDTVVNPNQVHVVPTKTEELFAVLGASRVPVMPANMDDASSTLKAQLKASANTFPDAIKNGLMRDTNWSQTAVYDRTNDLTVIDQKSALDRMAASLRGIWN